MFSRTIMLSVEKIYSEQNVNYILPHNFVEGKGEKNQSGRNMFYKN